ncbi:right-handed parallel beta-helix repeat-containing protein [Haloplanus sp.]|uniref:right-handed parallel beta-helix repeat-containing protein n=1 Tax=Haloplanus sp. TaxID=1961696 RepID=UPI0026021081|nr:right-handed parallel beta-helix repeat-containing protein [Haloplanus sp.]
MTRLKLVDFVAKNDDVELEDFSPQAQERINDALANLTDTEGGPSPGGAGNIIVSKTRDSSEDGIFESIQSAIDDEGTESGDTVFVEPGTYSENVSIDESGLTLRAAGPNETVVDGRVEAVADGVTLDGFTVSPPDPGDTEGADEAIRVDGGADGVVIANNVVEDFARNTGSSFTGIDGINLFGGEPDESPDPIKDAIVRNNVVRRLQNTGGPETDFPGGAAGISVQGNVKNPTVENNTIENVGQEVTNFAFGIVVRGTENNDQTPTGVTIKNNDVDSVLSDPESPTVGVGVGLEAGSAGDVTFTGNDISNTEFLLEDKTTTVDLNDFVSNNTIDRGALLEDGNFESEPGGAPARNVIFDSIQSALGFADPESTIEVVPGTYDDESSFSGANGLQIGSQDAGTDSSSAPRADVSIIGINGRPTIDGWVQILDPGITFEGFEVTGEVFGYGLAAFEPDVTVRDVTISGVTNGLFVPSASNVVVENSTVENYSFYGAVVSGRGEAFGDAEPAIRNTTFDGASGGGAVGIGIVQTNGDIKGNTITGNEFEENDGVGVAHFSGANVSIMRNTIASNDDGVFLAGPDAATVSATSNDIVNNRVGVANETEDENPDSVNATGNWWGSADGPGRGTNDIAGTQGPVDADPWSTEPGPNWNTDGTSDSTSSTETAGWREWQGPMPPSDPDPAE